MKTVLWTIGVIFTVCTVSAELIGQNGLAPITPAVLVGQPAPGANGAAFVGFSRPSINNQGVIAFQAELTPIPVSLGEIPGLFIPKGIFLVDAKGSLTRVVGTG